MRLRERAGLKKCMIRVLSSINDVVAVNVKVPFWVMDNILVFNKISPEAGSWTKASL